VFKAYQGLIDAVERQAARNSAGAATAEEIARVIRDTLASENPPLRIGPTEEARQLLAQRAATSDADWEAGIVAAIGLNALAVPADGSGAIG
jgi:hypothetical protein